MNSLMKKRRKILFIILAVGLAVVVLLVTAELAFYIQYHDFYFKKSFSLASDKSKVTKGASLRPH